MKIAVSVHGKFHGFDLARELNARDALAGFLTTILISSSENTLVWLKPSNCANTGLQSEFASALAIFVAISTAKFLQRLVHLQPKLQTVTCW